MGIEFLDEDNIIFSDKKGKILIYNGLKLIEVEGTPEIYLNDRAAMDIELHPKFSDNKIIFLSYAKKSDDDEGGNTTRAILEGDRLIDLEDIFIARHNSEKGTHWGSGFDKNGYLYFTIDREVGI